MKLRYVAEMGRAVGARTSFAPSFRWVPLFRIRWSRSIIGWTRARCPVSWRERRLGRSAICWLPSPWSDLTGWWLG